MLEKATIVVTVRDRFSTAAHCLSNILKHTPEPFDLLVIMGGAPPANEKELRSKFSDKARWIFKPDFLNTAQARNLALKEVTTRLVLFVDTDVYVRPGWYEPLLECQSETGADMVGPVVLDRQNKVHAAGNSFYVTQINGKDYASMEIKYAHQVVGSRTNIPREACDFLEVHCQLVVAESARTLGVYDENLREFNEMDGGLTLKKAGRKVIVEPRSFVYLYYPERLDNVADIKIYQWKWDMDAIRDGFRYFEKKWDYDLNYGRITESYFVHVNRRCNFFARRWPSKTALRLDAWKHRLLHFVLQSVT